AAGAPRRPGTGPVPTTTGGTSRVVAGPTTATGPTRTVTTYTVGRFSGPVRPAVVSTTSRERFAERARARRALARRQVLLIAAGVLVAGGLGWLLLLSPVLALDPAEVEVTGAGTVVAVDQVLGVVAEHHGTPLPRLDTVRLRDAVLEVPGVREARVVREWPQGLAVQLVSREPVAAVPEEAPPAGGATGFALLDQEGVQVGRADAAPEGLPVVDVPVGDARTLTAVLHVLEQLPPDLLAQVAGVAASTQDTVSMQLRDGPRVEWGSADETPLKVAVLAALRAAPTAAGATVYDVSAPRMPITR
ncbi:cell division protein FtsQ/DivIB, partial [Cellulomonas sp. 179-A 9B4 NHS]|uniref:cell division protein FtsQ/DivIB n=1 Tax=Cellulomonas sp. 179-A 9B4 NHS TaxID=3142379 RepID=UPI0039A0FA56